MCKECGCEHEDHGHAHDHTHSDTGAAVKTVSLEQKILSHNDTIAAGNRTWLAERGVVAINMISSPGAGKTLLLEQTLERLRGKVPCAVITGDQQTDNDAKRLENRGAPVKQIETFNTCHLDAKRIRDVLPEVVSDAVRLLFIENIGNLVCPAAFDLGETLKIALLSTTEGEDKPVKYPALFGQSPVVVLTKMDLVPHLDWNITTCREYLQKIQPGVSILELSARTGLGMDTWIDYLMKRIG